LSARGCKESSKESWPYLGEILKAATQFFRKMTFWQSNLAIEHPIYGGFEKEHQL
jgi:hypothetical protein